MGRHKGSRNDSSIALEQRVAELARPRGRKPGLTGPAIAAKLLINVSSVYRILRRIGVRVASTRDLAPLADRRRVLRMVARHGADKTADKLGVSRQAVYARIDRWDRGDE